MSCSGHSHNSLKNSPVDQIGWPAVIANRVFLSEDHEGVEHTSVEKRHQFLRPFCVVIELPAVSHREVGVVGRDDNESEVHPHG